MMKRIALLALLALAGDLHARDRNLVKESTVAIFTNTTFTATVAQTSTAEQYTELSREVALEIVSDTAFTSGETIVVEPLYILSEDGNSVGYALPSVPTDSQTVTSPNGNAFLMVFFPPEAAYSAYFKVTTSATRNVSITSRAR